MRVSNYLSHNCCFFITILHISYVLLIQKIHIFWILNDSHLPLIITPVLKEKETKSNIRKPSFFGSQNFILLHLSNNCFSLNFQRLPKFHQELRIDQVFVARFPYPLSIGTSVRCSTTKVRIDRNVIRRLLSVKNFGIRSAPVSREISTNKNGTIDRSKRRR